MMQFISSIRRIVSLAFAVLFSLTFFSNGADTHTVLNERTCKSCITVLSDCHIEGNNTKRYTGLGKILLDAQNNSFGNDVGIFLGDNTMNGQEIESLFFYGLVSTNSFADEYINVMGNHDIGNGQGNYKVLSKRFYNYTEDTFGIKMDKPYYYRVINGCYYIVIGEEALTVDTNEISDEQYRFIEETLEKAKADNAVTFICSHHPIYSIAETENYSLWEMLPKYKNVFFLSGHTHMSVSEDWTVITDRGINIINLPRCTENMGDGDETLTDDCGIGAQIEVYDDEVVVRIRNFYTGVWFDDFETHFNLDK